MRSEAPVRKDLSWAASRSPEGAVPWRELAFIECLLYARLSDTCPILSSQPAREKGFCYHPNFTEEVTEVLGICMGHSDGWHSQNQHPSPFILPLDPTLLTIVP